MSDEAKVFSDIENRSNLPSCQGDKSTHTDPSSLGAVIDLPKYYPEDHELTKWLIHQMRRSSGPRHLVNFANLHPFILSAHFEVLDQPDKYISTKETSCVPAYTSKTVLFLTPLAMAVYFGCKMIIRVLLDDSGSHLQTRARNNVDINATCFAKRLKPKRNVFDYDDYFTTSAGILALRLEFYAGLSLLSAAGFNPHDRIQHIDHIASPNQKIFWMTDIIEYALRLIITRPGFDIIQLLHYLTYPNIDGKCAYDILTYDVYQYNDAGTYSLLWFSLFRRVCRRGISPAYVNCASRLIDVLEMLEKMGFFKHDAMSRGPMVYDIRQDRNKVKRHQLPQKASAIDVRTLSSTGAEEAMRQISIDRDECFAFMVIWLSQLKKRSLVKPYQRLGNILLSALADTQMLKNFLYPPAQVNPKSDMWPQWMELGIGLVQNMPNADWKSFQEEINIFGGEAFDSYYLEPSQVHELRIELKNTALLRGLISETECAKTKETAKSLNLWNIQSPKPRELTVSPEKDQRSNQNAVFVPENNLNCNETAHCGDVVTPQPMEQSKSRPVAFRRRNASLYTFNQHPSEEEYYPKHHHQPRTIDRKNSNNGLTLPRAKTAAATPETKTRSRRRLGSTGSNSSPQVIKQKNVTPKGKEVTAPNGKNISRPRWQI